MPPSDRGSLTDPMPIELLLRRHLTLVLPLAAAVVMATWAVVVGSAHAGRAYSGAVMIGLGLAGAGRLTAEWVNESDDRPRLRDHVRSRLGLSGPPLDLRAEAGESAPDDDWLRWLHDDAVDDAPRARWTGETMVQDFDWTAWIPDRACGGHAVGNPDGVAAVVEHPSWPAPPWRRPDLVAAQQAGR